MRVFANPVTYDEPTLLLDVSQLTIVVQNELKSMISPNHVTTTSETMWLHAQDTIGYTDFFHTFDLLKIVLCKYEYEVYIIM